MCSDLRHIVNIIPPEDPRYNPKYDSIYNHDYGKASGTLGVNCKHRFWPYMEGVNTNNQQPTVTPAEAIKNSKLQQRQRQYERSIRDAKKRLRVAEELGDDAMIANSKTLITNRQRKLRQLIKDTNKNGQILARDHNREQIAQSNMESETKDFVQKRLTMNMDKQNVHFKGTMEYNRRVEQGLDSNHRYYGKEPSYFTISADKLDKIVKENIRMSKLGDRFQFIEVDEVIDIYKKDDIVVETTRMRIAQSNKGYQLYQGS